jgi:hypothetical protein
VQTIDQNLKRIATELLHQLYLTFIPVQLRAAALQSRHPEAAVELQSQDNMPLAIELHMSSLKVYEVCVKLLSMIESSDEAVDKALSSLGTWTMNSPELRDLELAGNLMSGNVERALRVLSPNLPFDIFRRDQRLPSET